MNQDTAILLTTTQKPSEEQFLALVKAAEKILGEVTDTQVSAFNPEYGGVTIYQP